MSMTDYNARQILFASAEMVRVEAMKAENQSREHRGESPAYTEEDFHYHANRIEELAREMEG